MFFPISKWFPTVYSGSRNLFFVIPCSGYFKLAFTFGDNAVECILSGQFSESVKNELINARKYAEGKTIQFEIRTVAEFEPIQEVIRIMTGNWKMHFNRKFIE